MIRRLPAYLRAEQRDRGSFLRAVYRRYRGADLAALERFVDTTLAPQILSRLSAEAVRRIREHRAAGHTTILITGVVQTLTRPLQALFDVIVAADLAVDAEGRCTGFLTAPPWWGSPGPPGSSTTRPARHRPGPSFAYADCHSDLPMLETVGNAVAVSPDIPLMRAAQRSSWSIVQWKVKPVTPRWQIPPTLLEWVAKLLPVGDARPHLRVTSVALRLAALLVGFAMRFPTFQGRNWADPVAI